MDIEIGRWWSICWVLFILSVFERVQVEEKGNQHSGYFNYASCPGLANVDSGFVVESFNSGYDYNMSAKTKNWKKMGTGALGPSGAMMTGRLRFQGPKVEAMKFMEPFKGFLRLTGDIEGDRNVCP